LTARFFTYADTGYCAAASKLREKRSRYFAACARNPWDEYAVRLACNEYEDALALARAEEDRVLADLKARTQGPIPQSANRSPVRFKS
jgi:hypothetical protein